MTKSVQITEDAAVLQHPECSLYTMTMTMQNWFHSRPTFLVPPVHF